MRFEEGRRYIVVMDRGFVLVGFLSQHEDALFLSLDDAAVVRRWGTSGGLGQLAISGPQPGTQFDPEGDDVIIGKHHVFRIIPCAPEPWKDWRARADQEVPH